MHWSQIHLSTQNHHEKFMAHVSQVEEFHQTLVAESCCAVTTLNLTSLLKA